MSGHNRGQVGRREFYFSALAVLVLDQLTKAIARHELVLGQSVSVIPGFFNLTLVHNRGGAGGIMPSLAPLLILITLVVIYALVKFRTERSRSPVLALSLGLLLGGAVGNLIDRLAFGYVTDFLDFGVVYKGREHTWPTFNVADIAITVGILMLLYYVQIIARRTEETKR